MDIGGQITRVIFDFLLIVIILALAANLSPTAIQYIVNLGEQMISDAAKYNNTLLQVLGGIFKDYGPVIWYGGLTGGAFAAIYDLANNILKRRKD